MIEDPRMPIFSKEEKDQNIFGIFLIYNGEVYSQKTKLIESIDNADSLIYLINILAWKCLRTYFHIKGIDEKVFWLRNYKQMLKIFPRSDEEIEKLERKIELPG